MGIKLNNRLAAVLVVVLLAGPAEVGAAVTPDPERPTSFNDVHISQAMTKLIFKVKSCPKCDIGLIWPTNVGSGDQAWKRNESKYARTSGKVRNGRWSITIPTTWTKGMSINLHPPKYSPITNYWSNAVLQFKGRAPGETVGSTQAWQERAGSIAWEGTTARKATIHLQALWYDADGDATESGPYLWVFSSRTLGTVDSPTKWPGAEPGDYADFGVSNQGYS